MDKKILAAIIEALVAQVADTMEGGSADKQNLHLARGLVGRALKNPNIRDTVKGACGLVAVAAPVAAE